MNPVDYLQRVRRIVDAAQPLGTRKTPDGTVLVGNVPHVAQDAWLHALFAPLPPEKLPELEAAVQRPLPAQLGSFYMEMNGLSLFSRAISIYGLRKDFRRNADAAWQPFNIATPNTHERPDNAPEDAVFCGVYRYDGSLLYVGGSSPLTHRCSRDSAEPLNTWPSFGEMLASEAERIAKLFDSSGRKLDPDAPTSPDPQV